MNLTSLEFFREVIETKSISKVAGSKHISQSALSQTIQKLEDELGYKLLERSNKGVEPTEAGKILFKHSGTMLRIHDKMKEELDMLDANAENIRINGYLSLVDYSLPCVLYRVKKKYPSYSFAMSAKNTADSLNDLHNDLTDLCFITEEPVDSELDFAKIGSEKIVLVANAESNIPDVIDVSYLEKCELILLDDDTLTISRSLKKRIEPKAMTMDKINIMFKVDSVPAAKSSVNNNLGVCFLPYMSVKKELYEKKYKLIEVRDFEMDFPIYLVTRKKCDRTGAISEVYKYFRENGEKHFC
jgi:DNA-binding transcriptional LysR family regulator